MKIMNNRVCNGVEIGRIGAGDVVEIEDNAYIVTTDDEIDKVSIVNLENGTLFKINKSVWCTPLVAKLMVK